MQIFTETQSVLQNAKSFAAGVSKFALAFKQHFPDDYESITSAITEGKRLADDWCKVEEGYMKVLKITTKNFDNEQQIRNKMVETLNKTASDLDRVRQFRLSWLWLIMLLSSLTGTIRN